MKSTPVVTLSHLSLYEGKWFHSFAAVQWSRPTLLWPLGSYRGGQRVKQLWAQCVQLLCTTVYLHWTYWISAREKWGWGNHLLTGWCSDLRGRRCELWVQARVSVKERLRLKVCALDNLYLHALILFTFNYKWQACECSQALCCLGSWALTFAFFLFKSTNVDFFFFGMQHVIMCFYVCAWDFKFKKRLDLIACVIMQHCKLPISTSYFKPHIVLICALYIL